MANYNAIINKLLGALNFEGADLTINSKQFKGIEGRVMTMRWVGHNVWDAERNRWDNQEIFRSTSSIYIVFYLRDMLFTLHGKELPNDQEDWNKMRAKLKAKGDPIYEEWEDLDG